MGLIGDIGRLLIELIEDKSRTQTNEDTQKIIRLLGFIAQGIVYGSYFAILGIGVASLYAGWMGMALVMLFLAFLLFVLETRKLNNILGTKKKTQWNQLILSIGFFLIAIGIMGFIDNTTTEIPRPIPIPKWEVWGIIGLVLTVVWFCYWLRRRKKRDFW